MTRGRREKEYNGNIIMLKINQKYIGIIYILLSAFFFALMNLFVKLSGDVPVMQKCFFRNIVASFFSFAMLMRDKTAFRTGKGHIVDLFIRAIAGTLGIFCNFYAIGNLSSVADATILNKLSPFFAIIFSIFILKEMPKKREWLAVLLAFVGALFVVKPTFSVEVVPALVGVLSGLGAGVAYTFVRKMGKAGVNGNLIIFFFSAFSCLVTAPKLIFDYSPMSWQQLLFLLLAGVAATGGQVFITKAYTKAPAKEISVYDYSIVLFAAVLGFFVLGEVPDVFSFIGYAIIILAAVGNWYFNLRNSNKG
jgi:drug/metabolite transporter (DMT)-like permease